MATINERRRARANEIISDLRSVFPPTKGKYVFGVMVKISYTDLIFCAVINL